MKLNCYVAIQCNEGIKYVTEVHNATHTCLWTSGKPALKMCENNAKNLLYGLVCNGYHAFIVKAPDFFEIVND